jgi:predicted AAA+ superfamily ATPase
MVAARRYLVPQVLHDLREKMTFVAGPRQVGKTTLAKALPGAKAGYLSWDVAGDRERILRRELPPGKLWVFDEIHKYRQWKNYLKGVYDRHHEDYQFLVSGSGRLDIYQRGGDSLAGRYELFHLWPLTLAELSPHRRQVADFVADPVGIGALPEWPEGPGIWEALGRFSGFPEPFLRGTEALWRRWSRNYCQQLLREDVRDLVALRSVAEVEALFSLLPHKVGAPLSMNGLAEDLRVAHPTVTSWLEMFERFYLAFRIPPWTPRIARAIQKERKLYLFMPPLIEESGPRLENQVALELWRALHVWNDLGLGTFSLHYVRNKEKQEVDFLLAEGRRPLVLIEVKQSESQPPGALVKMQRLLGDVPAVVLTGEVADPAYRLVQSPGGRVLIAPAWRWLAMLP